MGKHVNYFNIGDFHGVGRGSTQDREHAKRDPMLGPHPPGESLTPLPNIFLLQRTWNKYS